MYTVLLLNQKGGVGKTTIADELAFALERHGKSVAFVATDPQGGQLHEVCDDPDKAATCDVQVVDTAGVLVKEVPEWCRAADMILVPMLSSTRDLEPSLRVLDIVHASKTDAETFIVLNRFNKQGRLDRQLLEFLESDAFHSDNPGCKVLAKVPPTNKLDAAAAAKCSVADIDQYHPVTAVFEQMAIDVIDKMEEKDD